MCALKIVVFRAMLSLIVIVKGLFAGWMSDPPESATSNVAEEPGCQRVERTALLREMKVCFAVETWKVWVWE